MRVLVVDDHALFRAGLCLLIQSAFPNLKEIREASNGKEALQKLQDGVFDLVLLDIVMPVMSGFTTLEFIKRTLPDIKVVMVSAFSSDRHAQQAIRLGANGFVLKEDSPARLKQAITEVMEGGRYLSPTLGNILSVEIDKRSELDLLTARQKEVLQHIAEGRSTKEIASLLTVSIKTVETHRQDLMERLGIYDIAGLVRLAMRSGLVAPELGIPLQ